MARKMSSGIDVLALILLTLESETNCTCLSKHPLRALATILFWEKLS